MLYGGNLYKVDRVSKERYKEIESTLIPILDKHFGDYYRIPIPYHNKSNYGDVDIILDAGFLQNKNWLPPLLVDLGNPQVKKVRNVTSILYMNFQVDFFCVGTSRFHSTYAFMCYNILGNLIGRLYHKFNLKYGEDGLKYVLRSYNNHVSKEIVLTRDMRTMLEFVDLSYDRWVLGFDNLKDIFDYVIGSKYFCSNSYSDKYYTVRKRMFERPDFNTFLDYLKENNIDKNYPFNKDKGVYVDMIDTAFPNSGLKLKYEKHLRNQIDQKLISEKFNGRIVMDLIQLKNAPLGKFINDFKESFNGGFDEFIMETTQDRIDDEIRKFYHDRHVLYI